ncbi:MAG: bifunctional pyr operon transcriptional regulator/uracil phosphoribosyltransferase PyrR [Blastocatellia bacterium]|nr:bifunctional pyr operon transcriptional regulator/uracil phosphoribosyltransferase PyrR [Blastocatellia bacterium]
MSAREKALLMTADEIERVLEQLAAEIAASEPATDKLMLVGIRTRGVPLARRLAEILRQRYARDLPVGTLDITFYRDDLSRIAPNPVVKTSELPRDITGRVIILVDDVLYTGRTIRAALDHLMDYGRPDRVRLAVLVDRGHRELPIQADFVGRVIPTERNEIIKVMLREVDGEDRVLLLERESFDDA